MPSSFFIREKPKDKQKQKRSHPSTARSKTDQKKTKKSVNSTILQSKKPIHKNDEELESDDASESCDDQKQTTNLQFSSCEDEEETPQDKRLRLAKEYLKEIERQEAERAEEGEVFGHVSHRLHSEYLDSVGRLRRNIADSISGFTKSEKGTLKHKKQKLPICTLVLSSDGKFLFSGAKTQFVLKWNLQNNLIEGCIDVQKHTDDPNNGIKRRSRVIAMCLSSDMKFLGLAEEGCNIQIWCPQQLKHLKTFKGHRDIVTALVFRKNTHELYSGSKDRSVKIWSLDEMAYVETLFGHQASITGIDALSRERAITSGGIDCSVRIWKITEESQLIYNGHQGSIESVKFINDESFVSAGDDGSICLWSALKKKPLCVETLTHGTQQSGVPNWVTALACVPNTDLIASGSCDGFIRLWQVVDNAKKIKKVLEIPVTGFVNCLVFNADGSKLFAAVGQEHRLGRWWRIKEAKNTILVFNIIGNTTKETSES